MGRVLDLPALAAALEPVWLGRVRESGGRGGSFHLSTSAGRAEVRVSAEKVRTLQGVDEPANALGEGEFTHLLFRGFDEDAEEHLDVEQNLSLLRTLFPEQDFVIWGSDAFWYDVVVDTASGLTTRAGGIRGRLARRETAGLGYTSRAE